MKDVLWVRSVVFVHVNFNISQSVRCSMQTVYREFLKRSFFFKNVLVYKIETEGNSEKKTSNLVLN